MGLGWDSRIQRRVGRCFDSAIWGWSIWVTCGIFGNDRRAGQQVFSHPAAAPSTAWGFHFGFPSRCPWGSSQLMGPTWWIQTSRSSGFRNGAKWMRISSCNSSKFRTLVVCSILYGTSPGLDGIWRVNKNLLTYEVAHQYERVRTLEHWVDLVMAPGTQWPFSSESSACLKVWGAAWGRVDRVEIGFHKSGPRTAPTQAEAQKWHTYRQIGDIFTNRNS